MSERDAIVAWQPIETAPKDGTWILVWEATEWGPSHYVAQWGKPQWEGVQEMSWVTIALGPNPDTYEADGATHWMPLPPAPCDHLPASVAGVVDLSRKETCPMCDGRKMQAGEFCVAGCEDGKVLWTSANVLRNVQLWMDSDARTIATHAGVVERLREALDRQCDNMAFVLNKATLPDQWYCKFSNELQKARQALEASR